MYNKIFAKILDSSVWLESTPTRIVWFTFLAAMDETGFVQFASAANVAHRARVELAEAEAALKCLEQPDPDSSDPEHEGRRIERVPGGWMVLNAAKYRDLVTREVIREQTRIRVQNYRERLKSQNLEEKPRVTHKKLLVTSSNVGVTGVTSSDTDTDTEILFTTNKLIPETETLPNSNGNGHASLSPAAPPLSDPKRDPFTNREVTERAARFVDRYVVLYPEYRQGARYATKPARDYAAAVTLCETWVSDEYLDKLAIIFLKSNHKFAEEGSRTIPQFLALASWCDGKLREWATANGVQL